MEALNHESPEDNEIPSGWPLGLEAMNTRLRILDSLPPESSGQRYSLHVPSASFSSLSSSDLDTESTASFFQDHSVSLGRLIGIRPVDRGRLRLSNTIAFEDHSNVSRRGLHEHEPDGSKGYGIHMCQGICIPLLVCSMMKTSRSRSKSE